MIRRSPFLLFHLFAMQNAPMPILSMNNCKDGKLHVTYALCRKPGLSVSKKAITRKACILTPSYNPHTTLPPLHIRPLQNPNPLLQYLIPHLLTLKPTPISLRAPIPPSTLTSPLLPLGQCPNNISVFVSFVPKSYYLPTWKHKMSTTKIEQNNPTRPNPTQPNPNVPSRNISCAQLAAPFANQPRHLTKQKMHRLLPQIILHDSPPRPHFPPTSLPPTNQTTKTRSLHHPLHLQTKSNQAKIPQRVRSGQESVFKDQGDQSIIIVENDPTFEKESFASGVSLALMW